MSTVDQTHVWWRDADAKLDGWRWDHRYSQLPEFFFERVKPTSVTQPNVLLWNASLAEELGLDVESNDGVSMAACLSGNAIPNDAAPLAQAYAGHQFGHFTMLGDGRAILLGEHITPRGEHVDVQLKGAGRTRYSRGGDGRAALKPMLREYLISEAMHGLGIETTRALAVVTTGEPVYREEALPGAILTRIAQSHIRVGTFQFAAGADGGSGLQALSDHVIQRHYPQCHGNDDCYRLLLDEVISKQATLIARWQSVGFVHGVMNTDNMSIVGETIDYGPCAFMDRYDTNTVFSSIDHQGRYAYGNQPSIAQWNLARFAEALLPLIDSNRDVAVERATEAVERFESLFQNAYQHIMLRKLGFDQDHQHHRSCVDDLLTWMTDANADWTNTFRDLSAEQLPDRDIYHSDTFENWHSRWHDTLTTQSSIATAKQRMREINPAFIPRNHIVESVLESAQQGNLEPLLDWMEVLSRPYDHSVSSAQWQTPPETDFRDYQTFCGT
ncbi:MAG: YdiU family protein [Planctomycetota bacterium]